LASVARVPTTASAPVSDDEIGKAELEYSPVTGPVGLAAAISLLHTRRQQRDTTHTNNFFTILLQSSALSEPIHEFL
jgi:hypothetical protein